MQNLHYHNLHTMAKFFPQMSGICFVLIWKISLGHLILCQMNATCIVISQKVKSQKSIDFRKIQSETSFHENVSLSVLNVLNDD